MKRSQEGAIQPLPIALAVVVLVVISFSAYRIGQNNSSQQSQTENDSSTEIAQEIKTNEEAVEEITVPKEEEPAQPVAAPAPAVEKVEEPVVAEDKKDKVYLNITLAGATQDGVVVNVTSNIESPVTGTCNFKLYQEGYEKVYSSNQISNSQTCSGQLDVSSLPTYDGWELHVWFDGSDGKTFAYQEEQPFALNDPS